MVFRVIAINWLATFSVLLSAASNAAIVTWDFEAEVRNIYGSTLLVQQLEDSGIVGGLAVSGSIVFDTSVFDTNPTDYGGFYMGAITFFDAHISELAIVSDNSFNRIGTTNSDQDQIDASTSVSIEGLEEISASFILALEDSSGTFLSSDEIPLEPYGLSDFDQFAPMNGFFGTGFYLSVLANGDYGTVESELTSFEVSVVPLPASVWLFVGSLGVLYSFSRGK